jgi:hypothetical protein
MHAYALQVFAVGINQVRNESQCEEPGENVVACADVVHTFANWDKVTLLALVQKDKSA